MGTIHSTLPAYHISCLWDSVEIFSCRVFKHRLFGKYLSIEHIVIAKDFRELRNADGGSEKGQHAFILIPIEGLNRCVFSNVWITED